MKTIFKLSATAGLLFTVAVGMAREPKMELISKGEVKSLVFQMDSPTSETFVKLMDDQDHIIFNDKVSSGNYAKKFNLSALEDGHYYFSTENAIKTLVYTISIDDSELTLIDRKERTKPVFRKKEDKIFLNLLNLDGNDVDIKILDSDHRTIYAETIKDETIVEKAFNFEDAFEDTYTIIVKDKEDSYYEYVTVYN